MTHCKIKTMRDLISILLISFFVVFSLEGQNLSRDKFSIQNVKVTPNLSIGGLEGIKVNMDVRYDERIEDFSSRNFYVYWELYDENDFRLSASDDISDYSLKRKSIFLRTPVNNSSAEYLECNVTLFLPYKYLNLPAGNQNVTAKFYVENNREWKAWVGKEKLILNAPEVSTYSLRKQKFDVRNVRHENTFTQAGGMSCTKVKFDLILDYGGGKMIAEGFDLGYVLNDANGGQLINRKVKSENQFYKYKYKDAKRHGDGRYRISGVELKLFHVSMGKEGLRNFILELYASDQTVQDVKMLSIPLQIEVPNLISYDEQEINVTGVQVKQGNSDRGIHVEYQGELVFPYSNTNETFAKKYYFFPIVECNGKVVNSKDFTDAYESRNRKIDNIYLQPNGGKLKGRMKSFIPYYSLDLPEGEHEIKVTIKAASVDGKSVFSSTASTTARIRQKKCRSVRIYVKEISAKSDKAYDGSLFGLSRPPDMEYYILLNGRDKVYHRPYVNNKYTIKPMESAFFRCLEGDEISIDIKDADTISSDDMGSYVFPYQSKGNRFEMSNVSFQDIIKLDYSFLIK